MVASASVLAQHWRVPWAAIWDVEPGCGAYWQDLFRSLLPDPGADKLPSALPAERVFELPGHFSLKDAMPLIRKRRRKDGPQTLVVKGGFDLIAPDMAASDLLRGKHVFYRSLELHPVVMREMKATEKAFAGARPEDCVGVHMRRFVAKHDSDDNAGFEQYSSVELFCKYLSFAMRNIKPGCFVLVSNDPKARDLLAGCARNARGDPVPLLGAVRRAGSELSRDNVLGMQMALADLVLLARTQLIIGSYWSSFSDEGSVMGGVAKTCVVGDSWEKARSIHGDSYHAYGARGYPYGDDPFWKLVLNLNDQGKVLFYDKDMH
eukprot:gnl/MRDRNA2_/MRDRNA2_219384_c0_seq1.p1 gnl/MRDRNA2_/MRDRNA2_219384_c0~~gnl/MRDRNA2_/MRDRNA2_219384_c0_seq1.p1  ORF type:complete len:320 (+),score=53.39 gnl/MRDRNA2_/MRDRNA2_219384_c0_seq1:109-1068(+)